MNPYLSMLLNRKRNDPSTYNPALDPADNEDGVGSPDRMSGIASPTISLRAMPKPTITDAAIQTPPPYLQPQQPTIPLAGQPVVAPVNVSQGIDLNAPDTPVITKPRDVIQEDRDRLIAAQNKPRSKGKAILETLGEWAGSGVGLPVHRLIHPGGTETERAQRQLGIDLGLQEARTKEDETRSTIELRGAQARKIDADLQAAMNDPNTEAEAKVIAEGLGAFKGQLPTPENDAAYARLRTRAAKLRIELPETYGPRAPKESAPLLREVKQKDGSTLTKKSVDGGKTWETVPDLTSETPEKPDTSGFTNEQIQQNINDAAIEQGKVEQALKDTAPTISKPGQYAGDPPVAERNPIYADLENRRDKLIDDQRKWKADMKPGRSNAVSPAPSTHGFSISGWLKSNKGKTKKDAEAFRNANYPDYKIVP